MTNRSTLEDDDDLPGADPRLFIQSVRKAMAVLEAFDAEEPTMTLKRLTERTGLGRSATQRFVHTLEVLGYLARDPQNLRYRLSNRSFLFIRSILSANSALERCLFLLSKLAEITGETVSWLELDNEAVVVIGTVPSPHRTAIVLPVGTRFNLSQSCAAPFFREAQRRPEDLGIIAAGCVLAEGELGPGSLSAVAPVRDMRGNVVAAITVSMLRDRISPADAKLKVLPAIIDISGEASKILLH